MTARQQLGQPATVLAGKILSSSAQRTSAGRSKPFRPSAASNVYLVSTASSIRRMSRRTPALRKTGRV